MVERARTEIGREDACVRFTARTSLLEIHGWADGTKYRAPPGELSKKALPHPLDIHGAALHGGAAPGVSARAAWHRRHCCLRDRQRGSAPLARAAATPAGPTSGLHGEELQLLLPLQRGWGGLLPQWHKGPGLLRPVPGHPLWAGGRHRRSRRRCSSQSIAWSCASTSSSRRISRCKIRCALGRITTRSSAAAPPKATSISTRTSPGGGSHGLGIRSGSTPDFGPSVVFEKTCLAGCGCCANTSTQFNPGSLPECRPGRGKDNTTVLTCGDTPRPGGPEWCG